MDSKETSERHVPVMLDRCVELLAPALGQGSRVFVDATLGMGGHSEAMLERFPQLELVGVDRDPQALELAGGRLSRFGGRVHLVHTEYSNIPAALDRAGFPRAHGILFDLGVSSFQLDERERGFAYSYDAPLDMRMDTTAPLTAADVLNTYGQEDLARIIREFGEERFAGRIARHIVERRAREPLGSTAELARIVVEAVPAASARTGGHPAKRTFQALRIEVNQELSVLKDALPAAFSRLAVGGRMVVMSYHSLEDRMVKRAFAAGSESSAPAGLPVELPSHRPYLKALTRGAEKASAAEAEANPRSKPVRLRAVERVSDHDLGAVR